MHGRINKGRLHVRFDKDAESYINRTGINSDSVLSSTDFYNAKTLRLAINQLVAELKKNFSGVPIWDKLLCFYPFQSGNFDVVKHNLISNNFTLQQLPSSSTVEDLAPYGSVGIVYDTGIVFDFPDSLCAGFFTPKMTDSTNNDINTITAYNNTNGIGSGVLNPDNLGFAMARRSGGIICAGNGGASNYYYSGGKTGAFIMSGKNYPMTRQFTSSSDGVFGSNITVTSTNNITITIGGRRRQYLTHYAVEWDEHYANCFFIGNQLLTLQERTHIANAMYIFNNTLNTNPFTNTF